MTEAEVLKYVQNGNNVAIYYFYNNIATCNLQSGLLKVGRKIKYDGTGETVKTASQPLKGFPLSTHNLRISELKNKTKQQNKLTKTHKQTKSPRKKPLKKQTNEQNPKTNWITILLRTLSCVEEESRQIRLKEKTP